MAIRDSLPSAQKRKQAMNLPAAKPVQTTETQKLPPPPAATPPASTVAPERQIVYGCGHSRSIERMLKKKCPQCMAEQTRDVIRKVQEKKKKSNPRKRRQTGRLPDCSVFHVQYDAEKVLWSGTLTILETSDSTGVKLAGAEFSAEGPGVFRVLMLLDNKYRKWEEEHAKKGQGGAEVGGTDGRAGEGAEAGGESTPAADSGAA